MLSDQFVSVFYVNSDEIFYHFCVVSVGVEGNGRIVGVDYVVS